MQSTRRLLARIAMTLIIIAILQTFFNFPIGTLFYWFVGDELSRYYSAMIFLIISIMMYIVFSLLLIKRRFQNDDTAFNMGYRGEILIHIVTLITMHFAIASAVVSSIDPMNEASLRMFEYLSYLGAGIFGFSWFGFFVTIFYGSRHEQRNIDLLLRVCTFMEVPAWQLEPLSEEEENDEG